LLIGGVPVLCLAAALHAAGRLRPAGWAARHPALAPAAAAAILLATLVHAVETAKFATAFTRYARAIAALAQAGPLDPSLGDPRFTSSRPADRQVPPLAWHSTTPFLAILATPGFAPPLLVVDPAAAYFWFTCAAATANAAAPRTLPQATRDMVRAYACLHR